MISGKNYIGSTLTAEGSKTYRTINPVLNSENLPEYVEATPQEIDKAVALASSAYQTFRNTSDAKKAQFLNAIAQNILDLDDLLVATYCSETGLPEGRAKGERGRTVGQLRTFANLLKEGSWVDAIIDTAMPERTPMPRSDIRKMNIPLGPVVVFGASNFPLAYSTAGGDTAAALAAGCPVIVKSHPMHAGTGELVASAIVKAAVLTGMPEGVFSNLNSSGIEVGVQLVKHPQVKAVGFTGSIRGGRALLDIAAAREEPIPVFAEMGSINPVVILPEALSANGQDLAETYAGSITLGTGQFCTNPGVLLAIRGESLDAFVSALSTEIETKEASVMLHPNIHSSYEKNRQIALNHSAVTNVVAVENPQQANYARQTLALVNGAQFLENPQLQQEVFGPYSIIVQCDDSTQLEAIVNSLEGQLTGTLIAQPQEANNYQSLIDAMQNRVGRLIFNGVPTGVEVCPAMLHGGPYPASTDSRFTAVGIHSIKRWVRPFSFQDWPNDLLPDALKNENPLGISRQINNTWTHEKV